jgi:protoporphyrinogen IX oxidase
MLWLKAAHIITVICWFAGIFYLPRILVYFASSEHPETRAQLATMAYKLYRFMTPIAVLAVLFGLALATANLNYYLSAKWMWLKFLAVLGLIIYHYVCGRYVAIALADTNQRSHVYFRLFNEIPVIFLLVIVILVVLKPF